MLYLNDQINGMPVCMALNSKIRKSEYALIKLLIFNKLINFDQFLLIFFKICLLKKFAVWHIFNNKVFKSFKSYFKYNNCFPADLF